MPNIRRTVRPTKVPPNSHRPATDPVILWCIAYLEDAIRAEPFGSPRVTPLLEGLAAWREVAGERG